MYKTEIINEIYNTGWLAKHCHSECSDFSLMQDLMQEIGLIVLEYKGEGLLKAYNQGKHLAFIKQIIKKQYRSETSPFWKVYRKNSTLELMDEIYLGEDNEDND